MFLPKIYYLEGKKHVKIAKCQRKGREKQNILPEKILDFCTLSILFQIKNMKNICVLVNVEIQQLYLVLIYYLEM
ncbi:MAG: hypothetical protein SO160_02290 [Lachnospiraceae bacterium]|nr:hypothetical protein [Lachnospiraceae bacterium]